MRSSSALEAMVPSRAIGDSSTRALVNEGGDVTVIIGSVLSMAKDDEIVVDLPLVSRPWRVTV